jgi:CRISPR-associated protein Cas1
MLHQPQEFKAILTSKRANLYYLEHCRVMVKEGRVVYLTDKPNEPEQQYWNIPIANTTVLLLGTGTSITQKAVRMLAMAGVLLGFSGSGGTPLFSGMETQYQPPQEGEPDPGMEVAWFTPQNEYRPTEYMQGWMGFWFDEQKRLVAAKQLQKARLDFLERVWDKDDTLQRYGFCPDKRDIKNALAVARRNIDNAQTVTELLQGEAQFSKSLYKIAAQLTKHGRFTRERHSDDNANSFLDHGNYLTYGLAASTLWVLGIPHGFAVMHGKTRRGALVFDVADLVKDALILPWAFIGAKEEMRDQEFRQQCLKNFAEHKAMDFMFNEVKKIALQGDRL